MNDQLTRTENETVLTMIARPAQFSHSELLNAVLNVARLINEFDGQSFPYRQIYLDLFRAIIVEFAFADSLSRIWRARERALRGALEQS